MKYGIPMSIQEEHEALHAELVRASREPGAIGESAGEVMRLLKVHIAKEEQFALPPLALLPRLVNGEFDNDMGKVLEMTQRLKADLPAMLEEHRFIIRALKALVDAAKENDRVDLAELAHKLIHHSRLEEETLYPASLLVGEYVALRLGLKR